MLFSPYFLALFLPLCLPVFYTVHVCSVYPACVRSGGVFVLRILEMPHIHSGANLMKRDPLQT